MKVCSTCKEPKPPDQFYRRGGRCRSCGAAAAAASARAYRERRDKLPHRVCPGCQEDLPAEAFGKGAYRCKKCRTAYLLKRRASSPQRKLVALRATAKHNAKKLDVPFDLTNEHLWGLWETQRGRCFYTETPLTYAGDRAPTALSLDRRIPAEGYVKGNVVLSCWGFNQMKTDFSLEQLAEYCERYLRWFRSQT